jgi:hypothetical protein
MSYQIPSPSDSMDYNDGESNYTTMGDISSKHNSYMKGKKQVNLFMDPKKIQEQQEREREMRNEEKVENFNISTIKQQESYDSICAIKDGSPFCSSIEEFNNFYTLPPPTCDPNTQVCELGVSKTDKDNVYAAFIEYYGDLLFTKVKENDTHYIYMFKISCQLINVNRYLVAVVSRSLNNRNHILKLSELRWDSFQTRMLKENYNITEGSYRPNKTQAITGNINMIDSNTQASKYKAETLPINIMLLHKKRKINEYNANGKINLALETYQTIVTF